MVIQFFFLVTLRKGLPVSLCHFCLILSFPCRRGTNDCRSSLRPTLVAWQSSKRHQYMLYCSYLLLLFPLLILIPAHFCHSREDGKPVRKWKALNWIAASSLTTLLEVTRVRNLDYRTMLEWIGFPPSRGWQKR